MFGVAAYCTMESTMSENLPHLCNTSCVSWFAPSHLRISSGPLTACLCQGNWRMVTSQEDQHDLFADELSLSLPHWHAIQIFFLPACIMNVSNILKAFKIHQNYAGTMAICSYVVQCGKLHARPVASSLSPWQRISSADCGTAPKPRSSLQWSHSLVLSSLVGFLSLCSRGQRTRKPQVWLASSRTKLLVDGDCHSIDGIRLAIRCLEEHCGETVHTTLFAPPKRLLSKKWRKFIEEDGMSFQPIHRASIDLSAEPNDQALAEAMRQLFKLQVSVALLTEDSDFIEPIVDLEEIGANITVLLPENLYGLIHRYKRHGVKC